MMSPPAHIVICDDENGAATAGADLWLEAARKAVAARGLFHVAVSGGSTPRKMHALLARPPYLSQIPWLKTHLYWVDERCVPHEDPASNYGAARRDLLDKIPIPERRIHPMPGHLPPGRGAGQYEKTLQEYLPLSGERHPVFDLILLGMGTDGHTASLFPGDDSIPPSSGRVIAVKGGNPEVYRLTLNFNVINSARKVAFLVTGGSKAETLRTAIENPSADLPVQQVAPECGPTTWILDREAAKLLGKVHR